MTQKQINLEVLFDQVANDYAEKQTGKDISLPDYLNAVSHFDHPKIYREVIIRFAKEACRQILELAAEEAMVSYSPCGNIRMCGCGGVCERPDAGINKQSIMNVLNKVV